MIEARAAGKEAPKADAPAPKASNVVNLMDVLQRSLDESKKTRVATSSAHKAQKSAPAGEEKPKKTTRRKKSAA
jgi:non-homologous end joining protein Ku